MAKRNNVTDLTAAVSQEDLPAISEERNAFDEEMSRGTFSLQRKWLKYIDEMSVDLTVKRRKPVSASEALRVILAEHQANQSK